MNKIQLIGFNDYVITIKCNLSWCFALNANITEKLHIFSLINNTVNKLKINCLFPKTFKVNKKDIKSDDNFNKLRDYQKEDVEKLSNLKSNAIFSEMRTGKTLIALYNWYKRNLNSLFIIVPGILQQQWQEVIESWLNIPAFIISELDSEERIEFYNKFFNKIEKNLIIIISKEIIRIDSDIIKEIIDKSNKSFTKKTSVIIDEAHFLRNYKSQQSEGVFNLKIIENKTIITGTPISNGWEDIFGIIHFLFPESYPEYSKFIKEFFKIKNTKVNSPSGKRKIIITKIQGFKDKTSYFKMKNMLEYFSVKRVRKEVMFFVPEVDNKEIKLEMTIKQKSIYTNFIKSYKENQETNIFLLISKLKTITLLPTSIGFEELGVKVHFIIDFLNKNIDLNVIIFSTRSKTFLEPLHSILNFKEEKSSILTGFQTKEEKLKNIEDFTSGKKNIILCNIAVSNLGLNLSRADTIIFADRSYNYAQNIQAADRFLPTTQEESLKSGTKQKSILNLICSKSIDEKIFKILKKKDSIVSFLNNKKNQKEILESD